MKKYLSYLTYLQFLPITAFIWSARMHRFTDAGWSAAFQLGAILSIAQLLLFLYFKLPLGRFIPAVNLFLFIGGVAFFCNFTQLIYAYGHMQASMLFVALFIVGVFSTIVSKRGFVDAIDHSPQRVVYSSLILLAATWGAILFSYSTRNYLIISGAVPFICLRLLREGLVYFIQKGSKGHI